MARPRCIGLLGGSFNPAHHGHRQISLEALDRLDLDEVWWLVSPQNPLKSADGLAGYDRRLKHAAEIADHPRIIVSDIEKELGTRYTIDTIAALGERFAGDRFVWLMGADNLVQFPKWKRWRALFRAIPIAIFPRPTYSRRALSGRAARRFARYRVSGIRASSLALMKPPAWVFLRTRPDAVSATRIRAEEEADWPRT